MAQLPRVAAPATTAVSASHSRTVPTARSSSGASSPVEQISISTGAEFDTTPFAFQDEFRNPANDDNRQPSHKRQHYGLLNASSESFASILQAGNDEVEFDQHGDPVTRSYSGTVSKAINTYEMNSKIISGTNPVRGTEISLTL